MKFHPVASIFPLMEGEEFEALKEDVRQHGLIEPIWTFDGKILDGRNRYRACRELGIEPKTRAWTGLSAVSLVVSLNLKRRHLTMAQRAMAAADSLPHYEAEARKRMLSGKRADPTENIPEGMAGDARDHAARDFKVNPHYIADAKAIRERAPDLADKLKSGEMKIPHAKKELRRREAQEAPPMPEGTYRVFYADPPWEYGNRYGEHLRGYPQPDHHYPTMTLQTICDLPIRDMADENAVLFIWATSPLLEDALRVVSSWGFKYKTSFVWDKVKHNFGHYNSVRHEFLLIATKGSCTPDAKELHDSVISIERKEHSAKPEYFRELIDKLYTHGNRIELFARAAAKGWKAWGNQAC
jgi:N6-adenosine-specific RNA methylase IME4